MFPPISKRQILKKVASQCVSMRFGLVVYGLVRSPEVGYICAASIEEYLVKPLRPTEIVASVDGHLKFPFNISSASRFLHAPASVSSRDAYVRAMGHATHGMRLLFKPVDYVLLARIDVEFVAPFIIPNHCPTGVYVAHFQHHGNVNDRFAFGPRVQVKKWFAARLALAQNGHFGESGACLAANKTATTLCEGKNIWFVRRRESGYVPDIDKATVWQTIPVRGWMKNHRMTGRCAVSKF